MREQKKSKQGKSEPKGNVQEIREPKESEKNRRWKYGALATVITVLGIILIVAINVVMDKLTDRYGWSIDLTSNNLYEISDETLEYLETLETEIQITVMVEEETLATGSSYIVQAYQTILEYERNSDYITVEFVDLVDNPTYVSQYADLSLTTYDILITTENDAEVISFSELYEYDDTGSEITASQAEQELTNAILTLTTGETVSVIVLTGYSENDPDALVELLEENRYEVIEQSLITDELSEEAEIAILFAPQVDLESESLKLLDEWLDNDGEQGRSLFVFLDPNYPDLPNLEEFLNEWGISLGEGYAFEASSSRYYDKFYYPIAQYEDEDYANGLTDSDYTIMALCRPVDVLFESDGNYETTVLLSFSETSGTLGLSDTTVTTDMVTGDVNGMVMSSHSWYGTEVTTSNVVVSGSALAFSGTLLSSGSFANSDYILGLFQSLSTQIEGITIESKDLSMETHTMTAAETNFYAWGFMAGLPVIVLAGGVVVWLRRRHR